MLRERVPALAGDRYLADELSVARELVTGGLVAGDLSVLPQLSR